MIIFEEIMSNFLENKNISITGGEGFLGQYVKAALEKKNYKKISIVQHKKYNLIDNCYVKKMYHSFTFFLCSQMEAGPCIFQIFEIDVQTHLF